MCKNYDDFIGAFDSVNTARVAKSLSGIGDHDYSDVSPIDVEQIILSLKPNSPKAITTIVYIMSLYAKYLDNNELYNIVQDIDRNMIWSIAKKSASKKFISFSSYKDVYTNIDMYEDYNSFYIQTLFRCLYEGIYSDDMSVVKNLRASDINNNIVTLRKDNEDPYDFICKKTNALKYKKGKNIMLLGGVDIIYDTVGKHGIFNKAIRWLKARGTYVKVGYQMTNVTFDETPIWWQELNIIGVDSYGMETYKNEKIQSFDLVVKLLNEGKLNLDCFITHRFKMSEYKKGFRQCLTHPKETIKVVLENDL